MRETPSAAREAPGARFLYRLAKKARKRWTGLTTITQDPGDLLDSPLGQAVVNNASQHILLRQSPQAIDRVGQAFGLTGGERRYLLTCPRPRPVARGRAAHPAAVKASPPSTSSSPATPPSSRRRHEARGAQLVRPAPAAAGARDRRSRRCTRRRRTPVSASRPPTSNQVAGIPPEYLRLFLAAGSLRRAVGGARGDREGGVRRRARPRPGVHAGGRDQLRGGGRADAVPRLDLGDLRRERGRYGPPDRWNPADAIFAAARYLRANGAPQELQRAIFAYNHSTGIRRRGPAMGREL